MFFSLKFRLKLNRPLYVLNVNDTVLIDLGERTREIADPFTAIQRKKQQSSQFFHNFVVKVADNFDINPDQLHSDKSIHILNQIVISTSDNDEIPIIFEHILNEIFDNICKSDTNISVNILFFAETNRKGSKLMKKEK